MKPDEPTEPSVDNSNDAPTVPQIIKNKQVQLDGATIHDVAFKDCILVYSGGTPPFLKDVKLEGCTFDLNLHAACTVGFLRDIANMGLDNGDYSGLNLVLKHILGLDLSAIKKLIEQETPKQK